jgi:hypothetical protein
MTCRISGVPCSVVGCGRPARELDNLCVAHWMGLPPAQRAMLRWEAAQPTESIDTLEVTWLLTARDHPPLAA